MAPCPYKTKHLNNFSKTARLIELKLHMTYPAYDIPCHTIVVGYFDFTFDVCVCQSIYRPSSHRPSIHSYFHFQTITVNINGFSPNLVCVLILWRSALGLLMGNFRQLLTAICLPHSVVSFPDNNLSKYQRIFTKLGMCIDSVEIWFGDC